MLTENGESPGLSLGFTKEQHIGQKVHRHRALKLRWRNHNSSASGKIVEDTVKNN